MKFYTDGSSTADVKSAYCVTNESGMVLEHQESIPPKTNNEEEYRGVIAALRLADIGDEILTDSKLVVEQVHGNWKVNFDHLKLLCNEAQHLMALKNATLKWIPREQNLAGKVFESKAPIVPDIKAERDEPSTVNPYKGEDGKWYYFDETSAPSEAFETKLDAQRALDLYCLWLSMEADCVPTSQMVHRCAVAKGWWDKPRGIPELLCLIHSEVSEALEAYRNRIEPGAKGWIGEELADIIIRVYDMAEYLEIDIEEEIKNKFVLNLKRPYRHGNKEC